MNWKPITTTPKDGSVIWLGTAYDLCVAYWNEEAWRNWFKGPRLIGGELYAPEHIWFDPTHWQPLPEPPKD